MNREDILRMAREAELHCHMKLTEHGLVVEDLEHFAALVAAEVKREASFDRAELWLGRINKAVAAEREAIAQSLDKQADLACDEIDRQWAQEMAAAVRARSNT